MSWFFTYGVQSIGASATASVLPVSVQGWFPLGLTGLSLLSKGLSRVFSSTTVWKHQFFSAQPSLWSNPHPHMTTGKTIAFIRWTFVGKLVSLLLNTLSRFFIAFLPRSKHLLVSWSSHHLEWFFWPCQVARGILVPGPGIRSMPPALEAWSPNHCATREVPFMTFLGQTLYSKRPAEIKKLSLYKTATLTGIPYPLVLLYSSWNCYYLIHCVFVDMLAECTLAY